MMTITKFCGAAVALVSSSRVFAVDDNNWAIQFQSVDTKFQSDVDSEITLTYLISSGKTFGTPEIRNLHCDDAITGGLAYETPTVAWKASAGDMDQWEVKFDLDKETLVGSSVWDPTRGTMSFCAQLQLKDSGTSEVIVTE